jgi:asparagine synthase (glutamine-hydrolysing)
MVFASEARAILTHPRVSAAPDLRGVSAYLTTIRTVIGERTLFQGVSAVRPGEVIEVDLKALDLCERQVEVDWFGGVGSDEGDVPRVVRDSVARHLRADVPVCCLLSGGLDSSIIAACAGSTDRAEPRSVARLDTYCSGAVGAGTNDDFQFARLMAERLGSRHVEAPVTREMFAERWPAMVAAQGVPLSTPNEVAINEVARRLRADGNVVALSGEGADELFGGYDAPLTEAARFEGLIPSMTPRGATSPGVFQLLANAWVVPASKAGLLRDDAWRALESDADLLGLYEREFAAAAASGGAGDSPLQAHLRFQRRINLVGLLGRLDSATMLAGVEGRTPLADLEVCRAAERLPMARKFTLSPVRTKIALREAFAGELPAEIVARPKASFPLPFAEWIGDCAGALRDSALLREIVSPGALEVVASDAGKHWRVAWPLINLAMWGRVWWG